MSVIIFTGQSGLDRKSYFDEVEKIANSEGQKFKVFRVGDIMYDLKPAIGRGKILDLPLGELNALLLAAFERIRREMVAFDSIGVNVHATFRWRRGLIGGTDYSLLEPLRPDMYVTQLMMSLMSTVASSRSTQTRAIPTRTSWSGGKRKSSRHHSSRR